MTSGDRRKWAEASKGVRSWMWDGGTRVAQATRRAKVASARICNGAAQATSAAPGTREAESGSYLGLNQGLSSPAHADQLHTTAPMEAFHGSPVSLGQSDPPRCWP